MWLRARLVVRAVVGGRLSQVMALLGTALLLNGCILISGEQTSSDTPATGGNLNTSFVSAEGTDERWFTTGQPATLNVIASVTVERGDMRLEVLNPDGSVVLSVASQPDEREISRMGNVTTDDRGRLRYRVTARDARNGSFQILYQRQ